MLGRPSLLPNKIIFKYDSPVSRHGLVCVCNYRPYIQISLSSSGLLPVWTAFHMLLSSAMSVLLLDFVSTRHFVMSLLSIYDLFLLLSEMISFCTIMTCSIFQTDHSIQACRVKLWSTLYLNISIRFLYTKTTLRYQYENAIIFSLTFSQSIQCDVEKTEASLLWLNNLASLYCSVVDIMVRRYTFLPYVLVLNGLHIPAWMSAPGSFRLHTHLL